MLYLFSIVFRVSLYLLYTLSLSQMRRDWVPGVRHQKGNSLFIFHCFPGKLVLTLYAQSIPNEKKLGAWSTSSKGKQFIYFLLFSRVSFTTTLTSSYSVSSRSLPASSVALCRRRETDRCRRLWTTSITPSTVRRIRRFSRRSSRYRSPWRCLRIKCDCWKVKLTSWNEGENRALDLIFLF